MDELMSVFIHESREQLVAMEDGLLAMEQGEQDADTVNAVFRAAHTIKGAAGVVESVRVERFTHVLENLLDKLRNREMSVTPELISLLLRGCDHLGVLLDAVVPGAALDAVALDAASAELAVALGGILGTTPEPKTQLPEAAVVAVERDGGDSILNDCWHISLRFSRDVLRMGLDPLTFLRYLLSLGEIAHMTTLPDAMPVAAEMDPESCYLGFEISFRSQADKAAIEGVFAFAGDDCSVRILPPDSRIADYLQLIESLPEENLRLGEILVRSGALTQAELEQGLQQQSGIAIPSETPPPLGEILVNQQVVQPELVEAAAAKQKQVADKKAADARLFRVHADKLDELIDLVGELVIAGASANLLAQRSAQGDLIEATSVLSRLVEGIRDSALRLRMVQIGETFNRFQRVVRDVAHELGKEIDLVISGGDTELDKSVVEKIGDPLMHLVRNAVDHGIEPAERRVAVGKPVRGRLQLDAYHDSGSIVIEVSDDGGGLNKERILAKARERGIIGPEQALSEQDVCNLIFEPGFSTAAAVTNLSGRGVGMDVVKKNIEALRGSVDVSTREGEGTRFTIRLPLTLAIIDGFLVGVEQSIYVIPLDMVVECLELDRESSDCNYLNLRGEVLPLLWLRNLFEVDTPRPLRQSVVVVRSGTQKVGIVVDSLHGEFQTVIKPLAALFRNLRGIGGSTILGTGDVALILDVQALVHLATSSEEQALKSAPALQSPVNESQRREIDV